MVKNWPHTCTGQLFTSGLFMCAEKSSIAERSYETQSGYEASQSFASQIQPTPDPTNRFQYQSDLCWGWQGFACETTLVVCFCKLFWPTFTICCLFRQISSHPGGCTTFMPFGQLSNRSAWFVNGTTSPESQPKNWMTTVACLQTGQTYNLFASYIFRKCCFF